MKRRGQGRHIFYCPNHPKYKLWAGTAFLEFQEGVLKTDAAGAAVIRRHPLFGRLFTETPPNPVLDPHPELRLADSIVLPMDSYDCPVCEETLPSQVALVMHIDEKHQEVTDNGGGSGSTERAQEIPGEGEDRGDAWRYGAS
jgi:hypothetical protein